jgi:glycosyltransferase involved in cell wall biosynthesis
MPSATATTSNQLPKSDRLPAYVLITPARNEAQFIDKTLQSMVRQTYLPVKWVIVDDGSSDNTSEIVLGYIEKYPWIELVRRPQHQNRSFAGKVHSFNAGLAHLDGLRFDLLGNLDADISFSEDHFEFLAEKFIEIPALGVAGTAYTEPGWDSTRDSFEGQVSVSGACQLFRYSCFVEVGGYIANPAGGIDWIAVTTARMKGWKTQNFPERRFYHYRKMGTAQGSELGARFHYGKKDYFLGGSPLWELFRAGYQMTNKPLVIGGLAMFAGYFSSALRRAERPVTPELISFHRREQMQKLRRIILDFMKFRKPSVYLPAEWTSPGFGEPARSAQGETGERGINV